MRRDIRHEILQAAKTLFNERGYNVVSTRDIADTLGISKGNLTYYFKKKEEIVEAILAENTYSQPQDPPGNLEDMNTFFLDMQQVVQDNAFYFWHHTQLSQLSPKIHDQQHSIYLLNVEKFIRAFHTLHADGVIREEIYTGEYERMIDTLLLSCIYWMPFCELTQKHGARVSFQSHAWSVFSPLLTDKGRAALQRIVSIESV
jgi:AcrR family transcriptional regulator